MIVETMRFGAINIDEDKLITMRGPILGFERLHRYFLFHEEEKNPFGWFQAVDDASVAFVVLDPFIVQPDYEPEISDYDIDLLAIEKREDAVPLVITTLSSRPPMATVNLRAPILINIERRLGKQIVLEETHYAIRHDIAGSNIQRLPDATVLSDLAIKVPRS